MSDQRTSFRFIMIGGLSLAMLIPLLFVANVAWERQAFYESAKQSVSESWGGQQELAGPFLVLDESFRCRTKDAHDKPTWGNCKTTHVFLPRTLDIDANIDHQYRSRAIYEIPVYQADVSISGTFDARRWSNNPAFDLNSARLVFGITHTQALATRPQLNVNGQSIDLQATTGESWLNSGVHARLAKLNGQDLTFSFATSAKGIDSLFLSPIGDESSLDVQSSWPHPSFSGRYLPLTHEISNSGFKANWSVHDLARELPSQWRENQVTPYFGGAAIKLYEPITDHRLVDRGIKYGVLFISLTFVAFLCFEISSNIRFHLVQYGVVGLGLTLFYLTLLSLSEHIAFGVSYVIATILISALVSWYVWSITKLRKLTAYIGVIVASLYGVLFVLLTLEDYALLAGTGVLLLGLYALMYTTRSLTSVQTSRKET